MLIETHPQAQLQQLKDLAGADHYEARAALLQSLPQNHNPEEVVQILQAFLPTTTSGIDLWHIQDVLHRLDIAEARLLAQNLFAHLNSENCAQAHAVIQETLVPIPAGRFLMGSPEDEPERKDKEGPQHEVTLTRDYYLMNCTVTNAMYALFDPKHIDAATLANKADHPVVHISWWEAAIFAQWVGLRLPSEAEWEYAARGNQAAIFSGSTNPDAIGWYLENSGKETHPVRQKQANGFGLYDMSGNVWEWVHDFYAPYTAEAKVDPKGADSGEHICRGGGLISFARSLRCAFRSNDPASFRVDKIGFRLAR